MKRSTKIGTVILAFFLIITIVIVGRTMIGNHFKKKFSKRPPPGIIVTEVVTKNFSQKVSTYGTAIPFRTKSYKIEKYEIDNPIEFNRKLKKGDLITKLKTRNLIASFDGVVTKRDFSNDIKVSESSLLIQLEDTSSIYVDVDIPELYSSFIKENLNVDVKFSGNSEKIYSGVVDSTAGRIDVDTRSLAIRIKLENDNFEILPGSLLEIIVKYNERNSMSIPDTSLIMEGNKTYVYKVAEDNVTNKAEIVIGIRDSGFIEVVSGLANGDNIVAEGLKKVRPRGEIKPIKK
ncbi:efflux RND transporter periplasmic adaptor subunit [Candidatus Pelagibacter ubique]|jgi:membrane fusion protein (multidrug efflux system)|nr:efflux RND transporter periplasmic adaptor subunit [Candidatus Pelagibacter bacterium]MDA7443128.1 efflux RND transporter periplasmic adaptor subunit [Candidatus Pelagibacter ubique]MDA7450345.1 efflux RND transporter periplasmic adaptor subunit [Candidatus Pelagibacter ubique]MDA8841842.1 efflux RND transporter periplasmic adaptor subunit [Candidatus Pelagibacter bacterium]MDA9202964.1 efflux RND transporter periplasmic adaptor subunit [Candidatus Pelagibacter ubique]MDB9751112.1 efflux RN